MTMDVLTAKEVNTMLLGDKYLRLNTPTKSKMDKVDKANIDSLLADGERMYAQNKDAVKAFMERVIVAKYGTQDAKDALA